MLVAQKQGVDPSPIGLDPNPELRREWELLLLDVARVRAWERLLFVACGDGWIAEEASRRALRGFACGVDRAPQQVARATELRGVTGRLEFKTWEGARLPCLAQSFHRVFSTFALAQCADPALLLREMQRVLQPGGELYLLELERQPARAEGTGASGASRAPGMLAAALSEAGFADTMELVRRVAADGRGAVIGVIVLARAAVPSAPARPVAQEAVPPAA
jgi:ubiquinone/menaquinone biosynthesis C-methylase UbiE